jgi:hypothetical protein
MPDDRERKMVPMAVYTMLNVAWMTWGALILKYKNNNSDK